MTVSTSTDSVTYVATGVTNTFDYDFVVYDESHFVVTLDGAEVTSGFTVTGVGNEAGGTVVFDSNPIGTLVILRQVPFTQDIDYSPYDPFPAETHERGLDLGVMRDQQLKTAVDQAQADIDSLGVRVDSLVDEVTEQADRAGAAANSASQSADSASQSADSASQSAEQAALNGSAVVSREALRRSYADAGLTVKGYTKDGAILTSTSDVVIHNASGKGYSWGGVYPEGGYIVTPETDPTLNINFVDRSGELLAKNVTPVSPKTFGAIPGAVVDATDAIIATIAFCKAAKRPIDLRGGPWRFSRTLDFTDILGVVSDFSGQLICTSVGFTSNAADYGRWAVTFGRKVGTFEQYRHNGCVITGTFVVVCEDRTEELYGVYLKGSWFNVGHIRVQGFNGHGVMRDSVWDSTFQRISVELCGSTTKSAYWHASFGDTSNSSFTAALQVERAYHKAVYINAIRDVIVNIHAERTYQLTADDSSTNSNGTKWLNSSITLSNSEIRQAIFDSATVNPPTGETIVTGQAYNLQIGGDDLCASTVQVLGSVFTTYGGGVTLGLRCTYFANTSANSVLTLQNPAINTAVIYSATVIGGSITSLNAAFNATNTSYFGTKIGTIEFTNNIQGAIDFNSCVITEIKNVSAITDAAKGPVEFNMCTITTLTGGFNSRINIHGGQIANFLTVSQSMPHLYNVRIGKFAPVGNNGYVTRGCTAATITNAWSYPTNVNLPAGTVTERIGYNSVGKIYQNIDGAVNWVKIA